MQSLVVRLDNALHHGARRTVEPSMIVIHTTDGDSALSSIQYLNTTRDKIASYHYVVDRDGKMYRMTDPNFVAYHAGDSKWPDPIRATQANPKPNGGHSVNNCSLGVAWANRGEPLTTQQIASGLWLCSLFHEMYDIEIARILGHYEVAPGRKTDPMPAMEMNHWRELVTQYLNR